MSVCDVTKVRFCDKKNSNFFQAIFDQSPVPQNRFFGATDQFVLIGVSAAEWLSNKTRRYWLHLLIANTKTTGQ